jgi:hypothetical protein
LCPLLAQGQLDIFQWHCKFPKIIPTINISLIFPLFRLEYKIKPIDLILRAKITFYGTSFSS